MHSGNRGLAKGSTCTYSHTVSRLEGSTTHFQSDFDQILSNNSTIYVPENHGMVTYLY